MSRAVTQDSKNGVVIVGGVRVPGSIDDIRHCPHCGSARIYHDDYDSYFCPVCNMWLESACSDPSCSYCRSRPERPLPEPKAT
jgi:hypothetical protein